MQPIEINSLKESFRVFSKDLEEPFGIIFRGHGKVENLEFFLKLGDKWIANSDLLNIFRAGCSGAHPISIIYASCHSAAAVRHAQSLPKGSIVIGLSDAEAIDGDVQRWVDALATKWPADVSAVSLLEVYLLHGVRNRFSPTIALINDFGISEYVLNDLFLRILGTSVPRAVVTRVRERGKCGNDIERVATKVLNARNEYSIDAAEYGAALALGLECEFQKLVAF